MVAGAHYGEYALAKGTSWTYTRFGSLQSTCSSYTVRCTGTLWRGRSSPSSSWSKLFPWSWTTNYSSGLSSWSTPPFSSTTLLYFSCNLSSPWSRGGTGVSFRARREEDRFESDRRLEIRTLSSCLWVHTLWTLQSSPGPSRD